jgi:hypothetical protein
MRKAKKSVQIEVLAPARRPSDEAKAMLAKLVEQKVNEALSGKSDDSIFEPFFQPQSVANQMKGLMSVSQQQKFAAYFEEWGCMRCNTKKTGHNSLGMCLRCHHLIGDRLRACIRELDAERPDSIPALDRTDMAQQAILDILKGKR